MQFNDRVAGACVGPAGCGGGLGRYDQLVNSPKDMALYGELFGWEEKHKSELAGAIRPLANIGVLFSHATRDMTDGSGGANCYVRELVGWCEALTDEYIPYAIIVDEELTPSRLRQYQLVILPNAACLSDAACLAVGEYVAHGGNLIFTHETGLCDETGWKKINQNRLGVFRSAIKQGAANGESSVQFGKHGLGKWAYFAHKPGRAVYTHSLNILGKPRRRDTEDFETIPDVSTEDQILQKSLMIQTVRWAIADQLPLTVKQAPAGLLIKAFQHRNNKRQAVVIHLLNCRGEDSVKFGEIIPEKYPVGFPFLENDIILELRLDSIKRAYLISPDWTGRKPVKFNRIDNVFHLTIPARTLKRYEVLYIFNT